MADKKQTITAIVVSAAVGLGVHFVASKEGYSTVSYHDAKGVSTICYGATRNVDGTMVRMGQTATQDQCGEMLTAQYTQEINYVLKTTGVTLTSTQLAGLASFTYNVGEGNWYNSTARKEINKGHWELGCNALRWYVFVGKMDCRLDKYKNICGGIVTRRNSERDMCLNK